MSETTIAAPQQDHAPGSDTSAPSQRSAKPALSSRELSLLIALLLVAATVILYKPVLHHFFVLYDDPLYVVENTHVRGGLSWDNARWAFTAVAADNWHPLTWISHMVDVQLFALKPMGHHLDSILWHALNVVLLFLLLRAASGYVWRSATVAALFAFCPLNVECVAWVAERKSLISTTFLLLALFAYGWYVRRPNAVRYMSVALLFALGLMAKPMIITLPALLLLVDYWPLQRFGRLADEPSRLRRLGQLVLEKVPLLLLSAASAAITVYAQRAGGALDSTATIPMRFRIENAIYSYALYVVKAIWPSRLAVFYPHPGASLSKWVVLAAGLALITMTAVVWRFRDKKFLAAGWIWFVVTLFPVIGIVQVGQQGWADRYAYIPFIGIFVISVWLVSDLTVALRFQRPILMAAALGALAAYASVSYAQIGYWTDSFSLFSHALQVTTRNGVAEANLGVTLLNAGRPDLAESHLRAAVEFMPNVATSYYDLGVILQQEGRLDEALNDYRLGLPYTADPNEAARTHNNIGRIFLTKNDLPAALAEYDAALGLHPEEPHSLLGRGTVEYRQRRLDTALADLTRSAQLSPTPTTYLVMGRAYEGKGNIEAAAKSYEAALALDPTLAEASSRLSALAQGPTR